MWTVTYQLNGSRQQKIFFDALKLRSFLKDNESNPEFKLVSVIQALI